MADALKVLMIEILGDGGIAHYTFNLLNALRGRGLDASLCTRAGHELSGETCRYAAYPLMFRCAVGMIERLPRLDEERTLPTLFRRVVKMAEYPWNIVAVLRLMRREGMGTAHFQSIHWIEVAMIGAVKLAGRKIVYTIHNVSPLHGRVRLHHRIIMGLTYRICDALIIHTEEGKERVANLFKVEPEKMRVIPHGEYSFFVPSERCGSGEAKERLLGDRNASTILFFGAIRRNKGLDQAILALRHVRKRVDNARLLVVGELCEDWERYGALIEQEGVGDRVFTHLRYVPKEEVGSFFEAADVVVLPYYEITMSGVLQIAFAFSKPVVASDLDGFRESIEEGKNGHLVPVGDVRLWAERIADLLESEESRQRMGRRSRRMAQEKYSWDRIAAETEEVYRSVW